MRRKSSFTDTADCCVWCWDAISGSGLPAWFRHHVRFYREYSLTSTWVRGRQNISFCRCGMADKTLPSRTTEQRFISSTVGLEHSQTSWCTLTELPSKLYHLCLPVSIFFWYKPAVKSDGKRQHCTPLTHSTAPCPCVTQGLWGAGLLMYRV